MSHVSAVRCHLSLTPTDTATDPPPAKKIIETLRRNFFFKLANISNTLLDQKSPVGKRGVQDRGDKQTDRHTDRQTDNRQNSLGAYSVNKVGMAHCAL